MRIFMILTGLDVEILFLGDVDVGICDFGSFRCGVILLVFDAAMCEFG